MKILISILILAAIATTACGSSMKPSDIKRNPHPKMRYELTLTIHDAPGPFDSIEGTMQYEVADKRCSPENPISGTWNPPHVNVPFAFNRVADNVYTGTVYLDILEDEDYYGLGVCHWQMTFAIVGMKAKGAEFSPDVSSAKIVTNQPETTYFAKEIYKRPTVEGLSTGGVPLSDWIAKQPSKFFSTTLIAKERLE
ncbi:MAG: hypothetical protein J7605_10240 [Variovorax sp.]|nr:hypothetical protein [Variovorax sp.]